MLNITHRAGRLLSTKIYKRAYPLPDVMWMWKPPVPDRFRQYILRMMVRNTDRILLIPEELKWLKPFIIRADHHQEDTFNRSHPYIYVTVRHGTCNSETDDVWHVDGFSMKKAHFPEHSYMFVDVGPTEFLDGNVEIPPDFDPLKHNIHLYIQDHAKGKVWQAKMNRWVLFDPYLIHRRPNLTYGGQRTMVRISFVPIPIKDDMNTPNPILHVPPFNSTDIRHKLVRYA